MSRWHGFFTHIKKAMQKTKPDHSQLKKKGYLWVTLFLFLLSISLHWYFGFEAFKNEQVAHGQPIRVSEYFAEMRETQWRTGSLNFCN